MSQMLQFCLTSETDSISRCHSHGGELECSPLFEFVLATLVPVTPSSPPSLTPVLISRVPQRSSASPLPPSRHISSCMCVAHHALFTPFHCSRQRRAPPTFSVILNFISPLPKSLKKWEDHLFLTT